MIYYPCMSELKSKCEFLVGEVEAKVCEMYFLGRHVGESKRVEYVHGGSTEGTEGTEGALLIGVVPLWCGGGVVVPGV